MASKVRFYVNYIKVSIFGWKIARKLISNHPGKILIITDSGIGDQVFALAYLRSWEKYNKIDSWALLTNNSKNPLYRCFAINEDHLITLPQSDYENYLEYSNTIFGKKFRDSHDELLSTNVLTYFRGNRLLENPCIFDCSTLTKAILRIPNESEPFGCISHIQGDTLARLQKNGVGDLRKTVLINPYATSCNQTPFRFFQKIADELEKEGFAVITSIMGNQKSLQDTLGICLQLDEVPAFCEACGMIIGARSGFMDLAALSDAKIICIDNEDYEFRDLFRLEKCWPSNNQICTYTYREETEDTDVAKIVAYTNKMVNQMDDKDKGERK